MSEAHAHDGHEEGGHATVRIYAIILAILGVVTALEVGTYFVPWFQQHPTLLFWVLTVMAVGKFGLVIGYYMHLRYDAPYYSRIFLIPCALAVFIVVVVAVLTGMRDLAIVP